MARVPTCQRCGCNLAAVETHRGYCVVCQRLAGSEKRHGCQEPTRYPVYCAYCAAAGGTVLVGYSTEPRSHGVCSKHREQVEAGEYSVPQGHQQVLYEEEATA